MWPNVRALPDLPVEGDERPDQPFHWGTGPYAGVVALTYRPKVIFMVGFDLVPLEKGCVNNIYKDSKGYEYIKDPWIPAIGYISSTSCSNWTTVVG
jgi:hypothetical protein